MSAQLALYALTKTALLRKHANDLKSLGLLTGAGAIDQASMGAANALQRRMGLGDASRYENSLSMAARALPVPLPPGASGAAKLMGAGLGLATATPPAMPGPAMRFTPPETRPASAMHSMPAAAPNSQTAAPAMLPRQTAAPAQPSPMKPPAPWPRVPGPSMVNSIRG